MAALLDAGADVSARDLLGRTPLHHVTLGQRRGDIAVAVALLLGAGADAQARDEAGETVLQLARRRRDGIALTALAKAGIGAKASRGGRGTGRSRQCESPDKISEPVHDGTLVDA